MQSGHYTELAGGLVLTGVVHSCSFLSAFVHDGFGTRLGYPTASLGKSVIEEGQKSNVRDFGLGLCACRISRLKMIGMKSTRAALRHGSTSTKRKETFGWRYSRKDNFHQYSEN